MDRIDTSEYRAAYNRGWRSGHSTGSFALEGGDARGEPESWYDGYFDASCGRKKWHRLHCPTHHNEPGGCGEA